VLETIDAFGLRQNCLITSFHYNQLIKMKEICPEVRLGWLVHKINTDILEMSQEAGLYQICPRASIITRENIADVRQISPEIRAWGINGSSEEIIKLIQNCIDTGCDGATLNWPDWVVKT
jgi:glycerophosphoryl diester phosphodiesterase